MAAVRGVDARDEINLPCSIATSSVRALQLQRPCHRLSAHAGVRQEGGRLPPPAPQIWIWDAEFRDTLGAEATADGIFRYAVYVAQDGKRGIALMNLEANKAINVTVKLPNTTQFMIATPEEAEAKPSTGGVTIPARSAALLMEI